LKRSIEHLRIRFSFRLSLFLVAFIWFIGIISPCLNINLLHSVYTYLKLGYSTVCHQALEKSFTCGNTPLLVCSRCTGIYFSVLITSFILLFIKTNIQIKTAHLFFLLIPMLTDVILYSINIYGYNKIIAVFTGILFGSAVFLYILNAIEISLYRKIDFK
jgi:uncharacterized membrane protein